VSGAIDLLLSPPVIMLLRNTSSCKSKPRARLFGSDLELYIILRNQSNTSADSHSSVLCDVHMMTAMPVYVSLAAFYSFIFYFTIPSCSLVISGADVIRLLVDDI